MSRFDEAVAYLNSSYADWQEGVFQFKLDGREFLRRYGQD